MSRLDDLARGFFESVGMVDSGGYRVTEVLLGDGVKGFFGGRDFLRFTSSVEVARENPDVEVLAYGSSLLQSLTDAALASGAASHFYLQGLHLTAGRTLQKVAQHARIPGHILATGQEEAYLHHHCAFRFKMALVADGREEALQDTAVDLHSGWITRWEWSALSLHASGEAEVYPETPVSLSLMEAGHVALEAAQRSFAPAAQAKQLALRSVASEEKGQVERHYQAIIERLEAGKGRKGANLDRIEDKVRGALLDKQRRLDDVERRYQLATEVTLAQLALVSYPKVTVPLLLLQGKQERTGVAVWDPLVHQGYCYLLK
ncbi:MAG: hypothetical protein HYY01_09435 [Chloroflexi bacterium]|nr:hypothetical protein [Chloroflexota bacterium]